MVKTMTHSAGRGRDGGGGCGGAGLVLACTTHPAVPVASVRECEGTPTTCLAKTTHSTLPL